jgi:hypothetical protein
MIERLPNLKLIASSAFPAESPRMQAQRRTPDGNIRLPAEYPGWMFERQGEYRRKQLLEARR